MNSIYTLANDAVFDQLIALLNSIEANYSKEIPVCVIPYDDNLERVRAEIAKRPQVRLFEDTESIKRWEEFADAAWRSKQNHQRTGHQTPDTNRVARTPDTSHQKKPVTCDFATGDARSALWGRHKLGVHRKFCCFDGPFEKFVFMDADTLLMRPLDLIFEQLDRSDLVVYDYQHKDPSHVFDVNSAKFFQVFPRERIDRETFCTGFFASKRGLFDESKRVQILAGLEAGDAEMLYPRAPEQSLMNYMVMKTGVAIHNMALSLPPEERTGNSVTSVHFETRDHVLCDKGNRLTYLHYIGITGGPFRKLCAGENIALPYRDIFLYYRYLHEPEKRPAFKGKPMPYNRPAGLFARIAQSVQAHIHKAGKIIKRRLHGRSI